MTNTTFQPNAILRHVTSGNLYRFTGTIGAAGGLGVFGRRLDRDFGPIRFIAADRLVAADAATKPTVTIGTKVRFRLSTSDGGYVTFSARVVKFQGDDHVWIEMPPRVRSLPFPPLGGKRYGLYAIATLNLQ